MWIWIVVAIAAAIGEVLTTGLFLAIVAVAAVVAGIAGLFVDTVLQVVVFALLSLAGITLVRPTLIGALGLDSLAQPSGRISQNHMVGKRAVVTQTVDAGGGHVRVGAGEFWSARAFETSDVLLPGTRVEVVLVDGITALVSPLPVAADGDSQTLHASEKGHA